jgi:hypothetical protein
MISFMNMWVGTGNVVIMRRVFTGCELFNADLSNWNLNKLNNIDRYLRRLIHKNKQNK